MKLNPLIIFIALLTASCSGNKTGIKSDPFGMYMSTACDPYLYEQIGKESGKQWEVSRLTEEQFAKTAKDPKVIILDARGASFYDLLHIEGAVNLPYTHFSAKSLAKVIPSKNTRILIYCRNNLEYKTALPRQYLEDLGITEEKMADESFIFPTAFENPKLPSTGLNLFTFVTLYEYGYQNVSVLDNVVDPFDSSIEFTPKHEWIKIPDYSQTMALSN